MRASVVAQTVMWETLGSIPGSGRVPWRREWLPTPVFWPGEFHGLCSPWGHQEMDMTERLPLIKLVKAHELLSLVSKDISCHQVDFPYSVKYFALSVTYLAPPVVYNKNREALPHTHSWAPLYPHCPFQVLFNIS